MKFILLTFIVVMFFTMETFAIGSSNRILNAEEITSKKANQDITITPTGTGDVILKDYTGVLEFSGGTPTEQTINMQYSYDKGGDITLDTAGSSTLSITEGAGGFGVSNLVEIKNNSADLIVGFNRLLTTFGLPVDIDTTSYFKFPVGTTAQRPSASTGMSRWNTDEGCLELYNSVDWFCVGEGGGGGSSGLNIVSDFSFEAEELAPDATAGGSVDYETYSANDELATDFNTKYYEVSYGVPTPLSNADLYVRDTFARTGLDNKAGLFSIWIKALVADDESLKLCVRIDDPDYSETCESYLEVPVIGDDTWNEYKIPIVYGASSVQYEIYDEDYSGSAAIAVDLVEFKVGNDLGTINESDTDSLKYEPTLVGFGTTANENFEFSRIGDKLVISGRFDCGTPTATEAQIPLPNSVQVKSGLPLKSYGVYFRDATTSDSGGVVLGTGGDSFLNFGRSGTFNDNSGNALEEASGGSICANGDTVSFTTAPIPIEEWKTGRVNAFSQRRDFPVVEAAGNSGAPSSGAITANVTDIWFDEVKDDFGLWDGDSFTADRDGYYVTDGSIAFNASINSRVERYINGSNGVTCSNQISSSLRKFSCIVKLSIDDILTFRSTTGGTLANGLDHYLHIQYFPTFADVIAQLNVNQMKGACFNTTYSETEIECGMRNGKMVYRRCFTVASDIDSTSTIATWGTNLKILNSILDNTDRYIIESHTAQGASDNTSVIRYVKSTGVVEVAIAGNYEVRKDTTYCLDYVK